MIFFFQMETNLILAFTTFYNNFKNSMNKKMRKKIAHQQEQLFLDSFGTIYTWGNTEVFVHFLLVLGSVISEGLGTSVFLGTQTGWLCDWVPTDDQMQIVPSLRD